MRKITGSTILSFQDAMKLIMAQQAAIKALTKKAKRTKR